MIIKDAATVWNTLRGIICVYKPAEVKCDQIRKRIINSICSGLNEMECRPPVDYIKIEGVDDGNSPLTVKVEPNLADHPLVVGPRYQFHDLPCSWSNYLGYNSSGVLLLGIRTGTKQAKFIRENRPTRAYRIKGQLGLATEDGFINSKIIARSTWRHVKLYHIERLLAAMQASHQKKMFELCGVDMQSQLAFELASQGPIRPVNSKVPLIYGLKCVEFKPPNFTLEIHCVNENETYLKTLIFEMGTKLHSTAHCTGIQCIRHSYFTLDHALLRKHWTLQHLLSNLEQCNAIIEEHDLVLQKNAALQSC